ncbi:family 78 glycoside hydrolase catalytic domain [uncultured Sphingomonas sp.]|uniref:family 78 glycoside hydrolase catalytic domain n=1 Tax=uncultured Sphingomonas sp. TaxID=158754 RepID=UPI0025D0FBC7|nr:family 78 glycoside hydrolase catalytic domain [uncultured Sphingomonas sp.]
MPHVTRRHLLGQGTAAALAGLAPPSWAAAPEADAPHGLLCNLLAGPAVVEDDARLAWIVPASEQRGYRLQLVRAAGGTPTLWDGGWVASDRSTGVELPAAARGMLQPDDACLWRVQVEDQRGRRSGWSAPQLLLAAPARWQAQSIWAPRADRPDTPADWALLRHGFVLEHQPVLAWLRITASSPEPIRQYVFRAWVNGRLVGVGPSRSSQPGSHAYYLGADVTDALRAGPNAIAALCFTTEDHAFQAELVLLHADGSRRVIASGPDWKARDGSAWRPSVGTTGGGYYVAPLEAIDARQEPVGWCDAGYDEGGWSAALPRPPLPPLVPERVGPLVVTTEKPASLTRDGSLWRIDFGRELVGGLSLATRAKGGERLRISLGEERNPDGSVRDQLRCGQTYREHWTLRAGAQTLAHWGYRAFRWVEIEGPPHLDLQVTALRLGQPWNAEEAHFASSDPDLNRVHDFCAYSIRATRLDLYQDTPTRERGPYEGDAVVNQLSELAVQRSYALARQSIDWLIDRPTWPTEYRLMPPILAWRDYLATGDDRLLRTRFEAMVAAQLLDRINAEGLVEKDPGQSSKPWGDLVDWPIANRDGFVFGAVNTVINAWQVAALDALTSIAVAIGRVPDARDLAARAARMRAAINAQLRTPAGLYRDGLGTEHCSQHATAFAIALGVAPDDTARAGAALLARQDMRMSVYGAQFLLEALYRGGQPDAALALMTARGDQSWLAMLDRWHATIVMEAWNPMLKPNTTFSHAWGTAPLNLIASRLAGVTIIEPGARRLRIAPQPGRLPRFQARMPTIRGPVEVAWRRAAQPVLTLTVPPNARADLVMALPVPGLRAARMASARGIQHLAVQDDVLACRDLATGRYRFDFGPAPRGERR